MFGCLLFRSVHTHTSVLEEKNQTLFVLDFDGYFWEWVKVPQNQNVRVLSIFHILTVSALQIFKCVIPFSPLKFYYGSSTREGLKSKTMLA